MGVRPDGLPGSAPALRFQVSGPGVTPHAHVGGEIDVATAPLLRSDLSGLIDAGAQRITLDLSAVGFIDSAGLGVLVGALRRLREERSGVIAIENAQDSVRKVLEITGLAAMFGLAPQ